MAGTDSEASQWLRLITHSGRVTASSGDSAPGGFSDAATDTAVATAIGKLQQTCAQADRPDLLARALPGLSRAFQRTISQAPPSPSSISVLLAVLRFFLASGEEVLHEADRSLHTFFRSFLAKLYADSAVAGSTIKFLKAERAALLTSHPAVLPQYFPLLLKILVWHGPRMDDDIMELFPAMVAPSSFLPLYPSLLDLPTLVLALEDYQKTNGPLPGEAPSAEPKPPAPEDVLALMDAAYTGSTATGRRNSDSDEASDGSGRESMDALFRELLKDENDGLTEGHWSCPGLPAALASVLDSSPSDRLKQAMDIIPELLRIYFTVALRDVEDERLAALLAVVFQRIERMFPDPAFGQKVREVSVQSVLAIFDRSPSLVALLKKPIMDCIGQPFKSEAKADFALHLCWAVGEHGGGGAQHLEAARQLFEGLELLLYENLAASTAAAKRPREGGDVGLAAVGGPLGRARLLCFAVTAISKLATWHTKLDPRARVCLSKVSRSAEYLDKRVWERARDHLSLMQEPAVCSAMLGPTIGGQLSVVPGDRLQQVTAARGLQASAVSLPFYLLCERQGLPLHDFSLDDILVQ